MANDYLQFSEIVPRLSPEEEGWLQEQLQSIQALGDREYPEDAPDDKVLPPGEPDFTGPRFLRDNPDFDSDSEVLGFKFAFHGEHDPHDAWGRHLWIYAEESGDPTHVAWLVRKFLARFRPDESWSLTFATTCSKLRAGEFGGGAVFVTAHGIQSQDSYIFVENQGKAFQGQIEAARLVQEAEKAGIKPEDLDEATHDAAMNNGGLVEQIQFLVERHGADEPRKLLGEMAASRKTDGNTDP